MSLTAQSSNGLAPLSTVMDTVSCHAGRTETLFHQAASDGLASNMSCSGGSSSVTQL